LIADAKGVKSESTSFSAGFAVLFTKSSAEQLEDLEERRYLFKLILLDFNLTFPTLNLNLMRQAALFAPTCCSDLQPATRRPKGGGSWNVRER
jgi:hypothetical protein